MKMLPVTLVFFSLAIPLYVAAKTNLNLRSSLVETSTIASPSPSIKIIEQFKSPSLSPAPKKSPSPSPTSSPTVTEAPIVLIKEPVNIICTLIDGRKEEMSKEKCESVRKLQIDAYNAEIERYNQQQRELQEAQDKQINEFNESVAETNQKLYEMCKENANNQYPEYPNGETPEHRNLRKQALEKCFSTYLE